jgi:MoxR-like ATPase
VVPPAVDDVAATFRKIVDNVEQVIKGKREVIDLVVLCLIAEGHLLIEDVPGVGKTSVARALAASVDASWGRIQFTPDLLPSDVVGVTVWNRQTGEFQFRRGAVFANLVLGDEINRASPKTQSALLEAMQEQQVTVDGTTYHLPPPFMVIATQNPVEHEGTYPLPESQLDRFLMQVGVGYPDRASAVELLETHGGASVLSGITPVATVADISRMARAVRAVHVAPSLRGYIVDLAEASRRHAAVVLGMSPRATLGLQQASRARAASLGREYVVPEDLKALAAPVLAHRLVLTPEAEVQGTTAADVVDELLHRVTVPTGKGT